MKALICFLILICRMTIFAQGTIQFQSIPDGAHEIPAHTSFRTSEGSFTLSADGGFSGFVNVSHFPTPTSVSIYSSTTPTLLGNKLYDLEPGGVVFPFPPDDPGGQQFNFGRLLTSPEIDDLLAGRWWINVSTDAFPNGELRGQILAVPEPTSSILMILGAGLVFVRHRRGSQV